MPSQIWFSNDGLLWNNDASADPVNGIGGVSIGVTRSKKMFVNGQSADGALSFNFGRSLWTNPTSITNVDRIGPPTTFNPATVTHGALSGGQLTYTHSGGSAFDGGAWAGTGVNIPVGKYYYETKVISFTPGANHHCIGVAGFPNISNEDLQILAIVSRSPLAGNERNRAAVCFLEDGAIIINGVDSGHSLGGFTNGDVLQIAMDFGNKTIWFRKNNTGDWNNIVGADPNTNTSGLDMSGILTIPGMAPTLLCPMVIGEASTTDEYTLYTGGNLAGQFYSPPTGFVPGFPTYYLGWPTENWTGYSQFDPTKNYGSGSISGVDNNVLTCSTIYGASASVDGHKLGKFYFEITNTHNTFFTNFSGGGVVRFDRHTSQVFWASASNGPFDPNGGGVLVGSGFPSFSASVYALGSVAISGIYAQVATTSSICVELDEQNVIQNWLSGF